MEANKEGNEGNELEQDWQEEGEEDAIGVVDGPGPLACSFLTGAAGTGKTYQTRQRIERDSQPGNLILMAATTGIAAVNLGEGVTTINSLLGYFNLESLKDAFISGRLQRKVKGLVDEGVREIVVDEVSMMEGEVLDVLHRGIAEGSYHKPLKLTLTGDFAQLSPIPGKDRRTGKNLPVQYAFDAEIWPEFARNTTKLTKVWRQADGRFLDALNYARAGDGPALAEAMRHLPVEFSPTADDMFDGTTIYPTNPEVDRYNQLRLMQLPGIAVGLKSFRAGVPEIYHPAPVALGEWTKGKQIKQPKEWDHIPPHLTLKRGALVMILANDTQTGPGDGLGRMEFANGSLGYVEGMENRPAPDGSGSEKVVLVRLKDRDKVVGIRRMARLVERKDPPLGVDARGVGARKANEKWPGKGDGMGSGEEWKPYVGERGRWVWGEIRYFPLRLAYATSNHKSQGLSLDRVQVNPSHAFFGNPAMVYVALSRCRTPQGLRVVGTPERLGGRCKVDERVREWL